MTVNRICRPSRWFSEPMIVVRWSSLTAEAVGRFLHGRRWREHCGRDGFGCRTPSYHPASESCDFCFGEGADVLLALHRRGLVRVVQLAVIERGPE